MNSPKYSMLSIKPLGGRQSDEELRPVCVRPAEDSLSLRKSRTKLTRSSPRVFGVETFGIETTASN